MYKLLLTAILLTSTASLHAETINLECGDLADKMVASLVNEGLLQSAEKQQHRAREISVELCRGVQKTAEGQHQEAQTSALQNWAFENRPDKPGNKRLKRLK